MKGFDYSQLLELGVSEDLCGRSFTLHLGPWEIASLPFKTVSALGDDPTTVREILASCFLEQPVLSGRLQTRDVGSALEALRSLKATLGEKEHRLAVATDSRAVVFFEIVRRWREATDDDAVAGLASLAEARSGRVREHEALAVQVRYRRRAYGAASALLQFLPAEDEWAARARGAYAAARGALADEAQLSTADLHEAAWFPADEEETEAEVSQAAGGAVTWGIP